MYFTFPYVGQITYATKFYSKMQDFKRVLD